MIVNSESPYIYEFSPDAALFALVYQNLDKHRIKVWDTNSNRVIMNFSDNRVTKVSCISWRYQNKQSEMKSLKKRKTALNKELSLMVGCENGEVFLINPMSGSVQLSWSASKKQKKIVDILSAADGSAFTLDSEFLLTKWVGLFDATGPASSKSMILKNYPTSLLLNSSEVNLFVGGNGIEIRNVNSLELIKTLESNGSSITALVSDHEMENDSCISIADRDRFATLWGGSKAFVLACDDNIRIIDVSTSLCCSVLENGILVFWKKPLKQKHLSSKKHKLRSRLPDGSLSVSSCKILSAKFLEDKPDCVQVAYGSEISPAFEVISLTDHDGNGASKVIEREAPKIMDVKLEEKADIGLQPYKEKGLTVGTFTDANSMTPKVDLVSDLTMEEKIKALKMSDSQQELSKSKPQKDLANLPKPDSLQKMLVQAIHSSDNKLLEECLNIFDVRVISKTIQKLPVQYVMPLIRELIIRVQTNPVRISTLSRWIKPVLLIHMSYLMTFPNVVNEIAPLYQLIDSRLHIFKKLLRLQGKLDLLDQQIKIKQTRMSEQQQDENVLQNPMIVFRDESELKSQNPESEAEVSDFEEESEMGIMEAVSGDEL